MIESATCCGCLVNPNWFVGQYPTEIKIQDPMEYLKLTTIEQDILKNLVQSWNLFTQLDKSSDADTKEFVDAIHKAQQIIALRVARRVDPHIWKQP